MSSLNNLAPIVLFVYNRPSHTEQTLAALKNNDLAKESELFIFCDGPRGEKDLEMIKQVYQVIDHVEGFKNVFVKKLSLNKGLAKSVIEGVGEVLNLHGRAIVLEDDIITSSNFLSFINRALNFYQDDKKIFSVTGFNYHNYKKPKNYRHDVFFVSRISSWGWATWKDRWDEVDFKVADYASIKNDKKIQKEFRKKGDNLFEMLRKQMLGKIDTWDIQVGWHMFKNKLYCVFPVKTLVKNIGLDSSGTHCHADHDMMNFDLKSHEHNFVKFVEATNFISAENNFLKYTEYSFVKKLISSRKKRAKPKYIIFGIIIAELLRFLFV